MSDVTNRLARLRAAADLGRAALALELGVHERTVYRWEIGQAALPEKHWAKLAERFGVSVPYLLGIEDGNDGHGEKAVAS